MNAIEKFVYALGMRLFRFEELRNAYRKILTPAYRLQTPMEERLYRGMRVLDRIGVLHRFRQTYLGQAPTLGTDQRQIYDQHYLNLRINRIYDLPDVVIDENRPTTINVLVPAFEFRSISAGFFGVFHVARFLRKSGWNVRLVLFDNFYFNMDEFRAKFLKYPGLEKLLDELEVDYIGQRKEPLRVSPNDNCLATVWYSAYFAEKIMNVVGGGRFLYLIQDYETFFFPGNTLHALADQTYDMNYAAIFSSQSLQAFFLQRDIGGIATRGLPNIHFNNACAAQLLPRDDFMTQNADKPKRRIVFYSRPVVERNMFDLTGLVLGEAYKRGLFNPAEWDCIGMGLGEGVIELLPGVTTTSLARMTLKEYQDVVSSFDICLTLMASPHPSLIPMDLGGSGALVVTNTFATKTAGYLEAICGNIIPAKPNVPALVEALETAIGRLADLDRRYNNAETMDFPKNWDTSLTQEHLEFVNAHLAGHMARS